MLTLKAPIHYFPRSGVNANIIVWLSFMVLTIVYCALMYTYVKPAPISIVENTFWVLREWSVWLILTPILFSSLQYVSNRNHLKLFSYIKIGGFILAFIVSYQVFLAYFVDNNNVSTVLVLRLPKHAVVLALAILVWQLKYRTSTNEKENKVDKPSAIVKQEPSNIIVSKGTDKVVLAVSEIDAVMAAGNYVEIYSNDQQYLFRSTLKAFQQNQLDDKFIQTHRSNVVNIKSIDRIKMQNSGNGTVILKNGRKLGLSKRYRKTLSKWSVAC